MSDSMIKVAQPFVGEEEAAAVKEVLLSGRYVSGPRVEAFEKAFADYCGSGFGVAVNSGTAALHIALAVAGVGPGDEVIVPPLTFFSTVSAVLMQNAVPIFADIDPDSYCLDPTDVRRRITPRTRAVIPVHLFGNSADMDSMLEIGREHNLIVIEDAAQAHGTEHKGRKVGSIGDMGAFSFFATKHMTTGEGGIILTDDPQTADLARKIRSHGMTDRDTHLMLGHNYRMNEIAAAIGLVQLRKLDDLNNKRIVNSLYLRELLEKAAIPWLKLPVLNRNIHHTFFWFPIRINEERLGRSVPVLINTLREKGVETRNRYREPLYRQKLFNENHPGLSFIKDRNWPDYESMRLENVETIAGKVVGLPNHPGLTRSDIEQVAETLNRL